MCAFLWGGGRESGGIETKEGGEVDGLEIILVYRLGGRAIEVIRVKVGGFDCEEKYRG